MVVSDTSKPSIRSSPWMRGAPQLGLSATIRKINSRICLEILRPPPTGFRTLQSMAQYSLNPDRCQRATVSGRTIMSAFFHWAQNRRARTQKSLSMAPSLGRGCWRLKTASCWRRARFSSIRLRRVRNPRSTAPSQSRDRSNMATKVIADRLCRLPCEVVDCTAGQDCDEGQFLVFAGLIRSLVRKRLVWSNFYLGLEVVLAALANAL